MRTLTTRIRRNDETGSVQRLLEAPIHQVLPMPALTGFKTSTAASRIVLSALWALEPRSLLTGKPYDRGQLVEAIQPEGSLRSVAQRILNREPENRRAWAANRILVLDDDLHGSVADVLTEPTLWRFVDEPAFFTSHALDSGLIRMLSRGENAAFLDGRQRRVEQVVRDFIERMAESDLEDTPPLDRLDLDEMDEERDDALA